MNDEDQLRRLLEAVRLIAGDLDVETVLRRIVEAGCVLVDARYGALGVIASDGQGLSAFIHHGVDEATAEAIGDLPAGHGVLGHLIRHPQPLRLDDVKDHPASHGFPDNHPPMGSFLGAPIRIGETIFGNLYLTEKQGRGPFTEDDEQLVVALAAVAGSVISTARLYDDLQRREVWRDAVLELAAGVLAGESSGGLDERVASLAAQMLESDAALLVQRDPEVEGRVMVLAAVGDDAPTAGVIDAPAGHVWATLDRGEVVRTPVGIIMGRPTMWVPVRDGRQVRAALGVARSRPFTPRDEQMLVGYGEQVSVAWMHAQLQGDLRRLTVIEDRERIGRDLHDTVLQRLFAIGLSLQAVIPRVEDLPEVASKVERAVDEIDTTVKEIRASIFALQTRRERPSGLRARLLDVVDELAEVMASQPRMRFDGPIDTAVPPPIADVVVPVLREALSNVAKHADADEVIVDVTVADAMLHIRVVDNGRGIGDQRASTGFGLKNLADRAAALGGSCLVHPRKAVSGTEVSWSVPIS